MKQKKQQKKKSIFREYLESIVVAVFLVMFIIRPFVVQAFRIPSGSMEDTLLVGDFLLVNKFIYGAKIPFTGIRLPKLREPKRGDIIVFRSPIEPKKFLVKRLVAKPGETVEIRDRHVWVNGEIPEEPLILSKITYYPRGDYGRPGRPVKVPAGSYYALGDNSLNSVDSRYWGFVPKRNVAGKVFLIHWPIKRIRLVK